MPEALFAMWTFKEACVKALGRGLAVPLDSFEISLDPLGVTFLDMLGQDPVHWLLRKFRPTPEHVLALALKHPDPGAVKIDAAGLAVPELLDMAAPFSASVGPAS